MPKQEVTTETSTPTTEPQAAPTSEEIAARPGIQKAFAEVFGDGEATEAAEQMPATSPSPARQRQQEEEEAEELESLEDGDTQDADEGGDDEGEPSEGAETEAEEDDGGEADAGDKESDDTLDPTLRQAAKRAGMTDEEIDQLWKETPEVAEKTFVRLHSHYNDLSMRYAQLGQVPTGQPNANNQNRLAATPDDKGEPNLLEQIYGPDKLAGYEEKYGEDFMRDIVQPVLGPLNQMRGFLEQQQMAAVSAEINTFFDGLSDDYKKYYGKDGDATSEQVEARNRLGRLADQIRAGAMTQGIDMTIGQALERANSIVASDYASELERKRLTNQVKKRSKTITNKPSQRKASGSKTPTKSRDKAMQSYARRAGELGITIDSF